LAFAAINGGTHQGNVAVWIMGNTTETASAVLNASGSGSTSYSSVVVLPNGTRTVSGAITGGSPLVDLNGANNVRIDGYGQLTLANTTVSATAGTGTVRFINGASNNVLANCKHQRLVDLHPGNRCRHSSLQHVDRRGWQQQQYCHRQQYRARRSHLPTKAVMSLGTAAKSNTGNVVSNNNIFDFFLATTSVAGVNIVANNDSWKISSNRFYQTASRTFTTAASRYSGIVLNASSVASCTISYNVIGFGAANGTGTTTISGSSNEFRGIDAPSTSTTTPTSIQGNVISGITQTSSRASTTTGSSPFIAIVVGTTGGVFDIGDVAPNTLGSLDGSSTITVNATSTTTSTAPVIGIYDFSFSDDVIANNNIGAFTVTSGGSGTLTGFRGILVSGTAGQGRRCLQQYDREYQRHDCRQLRGLRHPERQCRFVRQREYHPKHELQLQRRDRRDERHQHGHGQRRNTEIIGNTIHSLSVSAGAAAGAIYAIDMTLSVNSNVIERNLVHSLSATTTGAGYQLFGIVKRGPGAATVRNNMVRLGLDSAGASQTGDLSIIGLRDIGTSANAGAKFYYNSVYIGGAAAAGATNTYALLSDVTTSATITRDFKDNILFNARGNAATGKNYAIRTGGTAPNPPGLLSNYNDLYVTGTNSFVGQFNLSRPGHAGQLADGKRSRREQRFG
jgi:hypothetical protein